AKCAFGAALLAAVAGLTPVCPQWTTRAMTRLCGLLSQMQQQVDVAMTRYSRMLRPRPPSTMLLSTTRMTNWMTSQAGLADSLAKLGSQSKLRCDATMLETGVVGLRLSLAVVSKSPSG